MRIALACLLVAALHVNASGDAKIKQLLAFNERELRPCLKNSRGVAVVLERGKPIATIDKEVADDLAELAKIHTIVQGQCDEISAMIDFLRANSSATFKQIQKDFEERDKRIRTGRAVNKQALADAQPLIGRSVPRINKLIAKNDAAAHLSTREQKELDEKEKAAAEKAAADKAAADMAAADKAAADKAAADKAAADKAKVDVKLRAKFPSGRAVELPAPIEAWTLSGTADTDVADYAFGGAKGTVIVRVHAGAPSCEQIRVSATLLGGRASAQRGEVAAELKPLKPAWVITWTDGDRQVRAVCVSTKQGVVVGRTEVALAGSAPLEVTLARMVAATLKR